MTQDEKTLVGMFCNMSDELEELGYKAERIDDYKFIITNPYGELIDFYTKSNTLHFRVNKGWANNGLEYFREIVENPLDKIE